AGVGAAFEAEGEGAQAVAGGDTGECLDDAVSGAAQTAFAEGGDGGAARCGEGAQGRLRGELDQLVVGRGQGVAQQGVHGDLAAEREQQLSGEPEVRPPLVRLALGPGGRQPGGGGRGRG